MLFHSFPFLLAFLPLTALVAFGLNRSGRRPLVLTWLVVASLFFYGWWNPAYLPLLVLSVVANYGAGVWIAGLRRAGHMDSARGIVALAVAANLACIGYFKYAGFFDGIWQDLGGAGFGLGGILLPLGISFFTFQQIAYVVDCGRGRETARSFSEYALFVTFFPQLIAGPIVYHGHVLPQFHGPDAFRLRLPDVAIGLEIFCLGLIKKTVLADGMALYATPVFDAAAAGEPLTVLEAWGGALAYTFQLYFDFSGYSDMAVGLGRMFGLHLPLNFNSPYKARSIVDFWRRWHMTLSAFLRDYLYIPLGGNRHGIMRRHGNLLLTMLLGGLWHGAAWTFVFWGFLHGVYLVINHAWRMTGLRLPGPVGWLVTFLAVVVGWVFFRAADFDTALHMLAAMAGEHGLVLPARYEDRLGWLGLEFADTPWFEGSRQAGLTLLALAWVVFAPNTQEWVGGKHGVAVGYGQNAPAPRYRWAAGHLGALALGAAVGYALVRLILGGYSEFLYFQF